MNSIYLKISGFIIKIELCTTEWEFARELKISEINKYWKGFIVDKTKKIDFKISFIEKQHLNTYYKTKDKEQFLSFYINKSDRHIITSYQISIFYFQILLRKAINYLLSGNGFILHGSASLIGDRAIIFTGRNGAGKSTAMKLLRQKFRPLSDDTVIIKNENGTYYLYQTPFIEKEWWIKKGHLRYKMGQVFFLKKDRYIQAKHIANKKMILNKIINQFWTEMDQSTNKKIIQIYSFSRNFKNFYELHFTKNKNDFINYFLNEIQN